MRSVVRAAYVHVGNRRWPSVPHRTLPAPSARLHGIAKAQLSPAAILFTMITILRLTDRSNGSDRLDGIDRNRVRTGRPAGRDCSIHFRVSSDHNNHRATVAFPAGGGVPASTNSAVLAGHGLCRGRGSTRHVESRRVPGIGGRDHLFRKGSTNGTTQRNSRRRSRESYCTGFLAAGSSSSTCASSQALSSPSSE